MSTFVFALFRAVCETVTESLCRRDKTETEGSRAETLCFLSCLRDRRNFSICISIFQPSLATFTIPLSQPHTHAHTTCSEKQPPSNLIRPEPCERHRREMVRRGDGP